MNPSLVIGDVYSTSFNRYCWLLGQKYHKQCDSKMCIIKDGFYFKFLSSTVSCACLLQTASDQIQAAIVPYLDDWDYYHYCYQGNYFNINLDIMTIGTNQLEFIIPVLLSDTNCTSLLQCSHGAWTFCCLEDKHFGNIFWSQIHNWRPLQWCTSRIH